VNIEKPDTRPHQSHRPMSDSFSTQGEPEQAVPEDQRDQHWTWDDDWVIDKRRAKREVDR
jgi:hypothetical protein